MVRADVSQEAFTVLENELTNTYPFKRLSSEMVNIRLPYKDSIRSFHVNYHEREKRPLVVVDGDVPTDGFPQSARQVAVIDLGFIPNSIHHQRQVKNYQMVIPKPEQLQRRFLILPAGNGIIIRYREKTGARRYGFVTLSHYQDSTWDMELQYTSF